MKVCKIEGCTNIIWSKGLCRNHIPRKKIPQIRRFKTLSLRDNSKTTERATSSLLMKEFFLKVWNERPHKSELFPFTFLGNEPLTIFFHHILPKKKFPQAIYDKENIILLTGDSHSSVELNMYKYEEINRRRELLLIKYGL